MMKSFIPFKWIRVILVTIHQEVSIWSNFSRIKSNYDKRWEFLLGYFNKFIMIWTLIHSDFCLCVTIMQHVLKKHSMHDIQSYSSFCINNQSCLNILFCQKKKKKSAIGSCWVFSKGDIHFCQCEVLLKVCGFRYKFILNLQKKSNWSFNISWYRQI